MLLIWNEYRSDLLKVVHNITEHVYRQVVHKLYVLASFYYDNLRNIEAIDFNHAKEVYKVWWISMRGFSLNKSENRHKYKHTHAHGVRDCFKQGMFTVILFKFI